MMARRMNWRIPNTVVAAASLLVVLCVSSWLGAQNAVVQMPTSQPANETPAETYLRLFESLDDEDLAGHFKLARWCYKQEEYELLLNQVDYVLSLNPDYRSAKVLRSIALGHVNEKKRKARIEARRMGEEGEALSYPQEWFVSEEDVNTLRLAELLPLDRRLPRNLRENVRVRFGDDLREEFLDDMSGEPGFVGTESRRRFMQLPVTAQVQIIRQETGLEHRDRIEILTDPVIFREFRRISPIIQRGCGSMKCHGGPKAPEGFTLRTSYIFPELGLYTNFVILDRVRQEGRPLIDRSNPQDSLLLQYGLPVDQAEAHHPTEIKPFFENQRDPAYQRLLRWINLLRVHRPQTGIKLKGYPEPPPPGLSFIDRVGSEPIPTSKPSEETSPTTRPAK